MPPSRSLFLLLMLALAPLASLTAPPVARTAGVQAEIDALLAFRRGLRDPYGAMSGWDAASPSAPCSWRGVACAQGGTGGRVVELQLPRLRLSGPISPALGSLPCLERLGLRSNDLSGAIPASLARVTSLRAVFLQSNSLSGPIPPSFLANLTNLDTFDVSGNLLSGPVPVSFPPGLKYLDLSSNAFSGTIPANIGASMANL